MNKMVIENFINGVATPFTDEEKAQLLITMDTEKDQKK